MRHHRSGHRPLIAVCALLALQAPAPSIAAPTSQVPSASLSAIPLDIPATRMVLANGLTLIVHEDHAAPLVAINIWYHVGSKNEPKGKTGFAHLFEHLMFNGSENFNDDFFKATQKIGATHQNGTTNADRTNYFQTVPKNALDTILWLESDRMGHLLGAIDQARLDEQRAVVKNEKRQDENEPYAKADDLINRATNPIGHPYDHSPIGSMADLDAASLDDVKQWFRTYYGPSNAVIVLSGDITPAEARAKVERYFGDIPPGTPVVHPQRWVTRNSGTIRETAYDRVAQPRLIRVWNVPDHGAPDIAYLDFLAKLLTGDHNSRLYKRLVVDEQLATQVEAGVDDREIEGQFQIDVMVKPGGDIDRVEAIVDEELKRLVMRGPTPAEMDRIRTRTVADFARSLESISTKASLLAESQTYLGSPDAWKANFDRFRTATPAEVQRTGQTWLSDGDYVLHVLPFGTLTAAASGVDRKTMPMPSRIVPASFPAVERTRLSNGMELVVAHRGGAPVVDLTMVLNTGLTADFASVAPGTGPLAVSALSEGTTSRTGAQLVDAFSALGARFSASGGGEHATLSLSTLKPTLQPSLALYADVVMHPAFAQKEVDRLKAQSIASLSADRQDPGSIAGRLLPVLTFGADSPYGRITTEASIRSIDRGQLEAFHQRWFHPNNATLIVAGDTSLAEIRPMIEAAFSGWMQATVPGTIAPTAAPPTRSIIYLVDKPDTPQSVVRAALIAPPMHEGDEIAREAFNTAFGGTFTGRLNMDLREAKGWTYGAHSRLGSSRGSRLFIAGASVQTDKTAESLAETASLLRNIAGNQPLDAKELANAKDDMTLGLSSDWSTNKGVSQYLIDQSAHELPDDYYENYPAKIEGETLAGVQAAGQSLIAGRPLTWIVVGDRSKIESKLRALGLGEVRVIDADGKPVS